MNAPIKLLTVSLTQQSDNPGSYDLSFLFDDDTMQGCVVPVGASVNKVVNTLYGLAQIIERCHLKQGVMK